MDQNKWDKRYLELAKLVAKWSKDPNAQVGAVVVRNNRVIATGFNGFPSEVLDTDERLTDIDKKLEMVVHAEVNALIVAGRSAEGATIYIHGKPVCPRCAGSIIQAGIGRVVAKRPSWDTDSKWDKLGLIALDMFVEAGIKFHDKTARQDKDHSAAGTPCKIDSAQNRATSKERPIRVSALQND